jgi:Acyl-coenzyme A synthetases/AMP-(fatty) acid ligases
MNLLEKYLPRVEFADYDDFKRNYRLNIPDHFNFGCDVIDAYAAAEPDRQALVWYKDQDNIKYFTFGELKTLSDKTANMLSALGVGRGDTVMLMLKQRPEAWITIIALCKLGAVCIPATFQLTAKDIVYRCNSASVKLICVADDEHIYAAIHEARPDCTTLTGVTIVAECGDNIPSDFYDHRALVDAAAPEFSPVQTDNNDRMLAYFSSGTTGMPKMISHNFMYPLGHITTAKYWQHIEDGGLHLTMSDSGWAKFGWGKIYGQWIAGAVIVAYDDDGKFDAHHLITALNTLRLTTFCAPPTIYRYLIKEDLSGCDFSSLHHCSTAGEPLNPEVVKRFYEASGLEIYEGFGQSETSVLLANFGWDKIKLGSCGKPAPLYDIDILDEDGIHCEDGVVGYIIIKNAVSDRPTGLFTEYYHDDAAMERAWKNGGYNTGDTAWRDSDGYYWFEGRGDDVIKCSGYRIGPFEVESALQTHPAVLESAVTAVPDPVRGQVVKATIVLARGYEPSDALKKELQEHVKHTTAPYKYPRVVEFVKELPKTTSLKIKRADIRRADAAAEK